MLFVVGFQSAKLTQLAATAQFTSSLDLQGAFLADQAVPSAAPALTRVFFLPVECPFELGRETMCTLVQSKQT